MGAGFFAGRRVQAAQSRFDGLIEDFDRSGDVGLLARAVEEAREIVRLTPGEAAEYPERLTLLGSVLSMSFDYAQRRELLAEALIVLREAAERARPGHPAAGTVRMSLAGVLAGDYRGGGSSKSLDEAITLYDAALAEQLDADELPMALANQSQALLLRFLRDGDLDDQRAGAAKIRQAVSLTPPDHMVYVLRNAHLVSALMLLIDEPGVRQEIERALSVVRRYLHVLPMPMRNEVLLSVGTLLTEDIATLGTEGVPIAEQLAAGREFANALREGNVYGPELRAMFLNLAGATQYLATIETGDIRKLDQAILAFHATLAEMPPTSPARPTLLATLGSALGQRIEWTGESDRIPEMLAVLRAAVDASPVESDDHGPLLANLGNGLKLKYSFFGGDDLLDEILEVLGTAVAHTREDHPGRPMVLTNLGVGFCERYERWGRLSDLDSSVDSHRAACAAADEGSAYRPICLLNLGSVLAQRFMVTRDLADLDEAIRRMRESVRSTPPGNPDRGGRLASLAAALRMRYQHTDQVASLEESISLLREALRVVPPGATQRTLILDNLGVTLMLQDTGEALQEAVEILRGTRDVDHGTSSERLRTGTNLATAMYARILDQQNDRRELQIQKLTLIGMTGLLDLDSLTELARSSVETLDQESLAELDQVVELLVRTLRATPEEVAERSGTVGFLGLVLRTRSRLAESDQQFDQAVELLRMAVEGSAADSPSQAAAREMLAEALADHWKRSGEAASRDEAAEQFRQAVAVEAVAPAWRVGAAIRWAEFVAKAFGPAEAVEAYAIAVGLLDVTAWRGLGRDDQERVLAEYQGLASDAAACAIAAGTPELAVELLEQGRGVLLAQVIDARPDWDLLEHAAPELAARLSEIQDALDLPEPAKDDTDFLDRRHVLARRRAETLAEIRALDGFSDFLLPPAFARLRTAAQDGTVVIVNTSAYRCDVLAVTQHGVQVIALPGLSAEAVAEIAGEFVAAHEAFTHDDDPDPEVLDAVPRTLQWLDEQLGTAVRALPASSEPWPRLWWCPTGALAMLPLHAVTIDVAVSSYTPTLRALLQARTVAASQGPPLLVAMPYTPGEADLPGAELELYAVRAMLPGARTMVGPEATRAEVLGALPYSPWVHFACHAEQNPQVPSEGRLLLHDGPLTVRQIAAARLNRAELAFLSGCETARGGDVLADECISLAATLQLAGYPHVIGTLWPISDAEAPRIVEEFYRAMAAGEGPALALHLAVRSLRERASSPLLWAPFTHIGP